MPAKKKKSASGYMKKARSEAQQRRTLSGSNRTAIADSFVTTGMDDRGYISGSYTEVAFDRRPTYKETQAKKAAAARRPKRAR